MEVVPEGHGGDPIWNVGYMDGEQSRHKISDIGDRILLKVAGKF